MLGHVSLSERRERSRRGALPLVAFPLDRVDAARDLSPEDEPLLSRGL
jgi:hypothetical protein